MKSNFSTSEHHNLNVHPPETYAWTRIPLGTDWEFVLFSYVFAPNRILYAPQTVLMSILFLSTFLYRTWRQNRYYSSYCLCTLVDKVNQSFLKKLCYIIGILAISTFSSIHCTGDTKVVCSRECKKNEKCDPKTRKCVLAQQCAPCTSNADCDNHEFCSNDGCCSAIGKGQVFDGVDQNDATNNTPDPGTPDPGNPTGDTQNTTDQGKGGLGSTCQKDSECGDGLRCDTTKGTCVCVGDQVCSGATPKCEITQGKCVACLADGDCKGVSQKCNTKTYACETNCTCPAGQKCDAQGKCVPLCQGVQCQSGEQCDPSDGKCKKVSKCEPGQPCTNPNHCCNSDKTCAPCKNGAVCSACKENSDCTPGALCYSQPDGSKICTKSCNTGSCPAGYKCIAYPPYGKQCFPNSGQCSSSGGCNPACKSGQQCCSATKKCGYCCSNSDCSSGQKCVNGTCVNSSGCNPPCRSGTKCCSATRTCRQCCSNSDCSSGQSCVSGTCRASQTRNCKVTSPVGACTKDSDCCNGQRCMSFGAIKYCGPCSSSANCPKVSPLPVPMKCCNFIIAKMCAVICN